MAFILLFIYCRAQASSITAAEMTECERLDIEEAVQASLQEAPQSSGNTAATASESRVTQPEQAVLDQVLEASKVQPVEPPITSDEQP